MSRFFACVCQAVALSILLTGQGRAGGGLPAQADICDGSTVSKKALASYILVANNNKAAITRVLGDALLWRKIFTEEPTQFCSAAAVCKKGMKKDACKKTIDDCTTSQNAAVNDAGQFFDDLTLETTKVKPTYIEDAALLNAPSGARARNYFSTPEGQGSQITCVAVANVPSPPTMSTAIPSRFRLRGISDDLYVDRSQDQFKSTSQASATWTGDSSSTRTQNAKFKAALGYAVPVNGTTIAVPFVSFYQSVTDTQGKPRTIDPTNNVAGGLLATATIPGDVITQVISAKPQYLYNTKDNSQIESARIIYTPYTYFADGTAPINLNFFHPISYLPFPLWAEIQFDLRADAGAYSNRGNNPMQIPLNKDFGRAGSRFGLVFTTDPNTPSVTLVVTETLLYGHGGSVRNLNLFETSLTYNLDPKTNYLGLTASYRNGIDEDTAIRVQTWTVGFTARY